MVAGFSLDCRVWGWRVGELGDRSPRKTCSTKRVVAGWVAKLFLGSSGIIRLRLYYARIR